MHHVGVVASLPGLVKLGAAIRDKLFVNPSTTLRAIGETSGVEGGKETSLLELGVHKGYQGNGKR